MKINANKNRPKTTTAPCQKLIASAFPMIRGVLALQKGQASKELEAFAAGTRYELGSPMWMSFIALYSVYLHGNVCIAARDGKQAIVEFQKISEHRGRGLTEPIGALAHLGLGPAYAITGETSKAKTAYQDFFALWKDPDPELPIRKQAKAEYAKLRLHFSRMLTHSH